MIAPNINHIVTLLSRLYSCNRPPVRPIFSTFFDNIVPAFSINYLSNVHKEVNYF